MNPGPDMKYYFGSWRIRFSIRIFKFSVPEPVEPKLFWGGGAGAEIIFYLILLYNCQYEDARQTVFPRLWPLSGLTV